MRYLVLFLCLLLGAPSMAQESSQSADQQLNQVVDQYWQNYLQENPLAASSAGSDAYKDAMPSLRPEDFARRTQQSKGFLKELQAIDSSKLSDDALTTYTILEFILRHNVESEEFKPWRIPLLSDSGFHTNFNHAARSTPMRSRHDYEAYLKRLEQLPAYLEQNMANMRMGLKDGVTQPQVILDNLKPSFAGQVTKTAEEHPLYVPFAQMHSSISASQAEQLRSQAKAVLENRVIPAYQKTYEFFVDEYIPGARTSLGASDMPGGKEYYAERVRYYTTLEDATPDSIHQIGLNEVKRIRAEMDEIIKEVEFEGSFDEFLHFLRTDPQFYADSEEQLLKEAAWIAKQVDGIMPKFFDKMPRQPYGIEAVPANIAPNYTTGRYVGAPLDADRGGYYWVNTYALDKRPLYNLPSLTLHEAAPGHHHQSALAKEAEGVPAFRQNFYFNAFGEGWGLYSEKLGIEMGIYKTPYQHFGRLSYEMWRACRLVIDTGIHAKGWSRQQALDYLANNTALSLHNVRTEIDRYISWPGQALAYKMGELTILEMRQKAEEALGDKFDIRQFHNVVLNDGTVPLDLLRKKANEWIAENR